MIAITAEAIRRATEVGGAPGVEALRLAVERAEAEGHRDASVSVPCARGLRVSDPTPSQCHVVTLLLRRDRRDGVVSWGLVEPEWPTSDAAWAVEVFRRMQRVVGCSAPVELADVCPTLASALRRLPEITDATTLREWRRAIHAAMSAWDTDGERVACERAESSGYDRPSCVVRGINALRAALVWATASQSDLSPSRLDAVRAWERYESQHPLSAESAT